MGKLDLDQLHISDETLDVYRAEAARSGRSLEEELRDAIERARPASPRRDPDALIKLSRALRAMTPPDGPDGSFDSTLLIRWDRDSDHGRWLDDGWADHVAGR